MDGFMNLFHNLNDYFVYGFYKEFISPVKMSL